MIEIIKITNHHQWDGKILTEKEFDNLIELLKLSRFGFVCHFIKNGDKYIIV